MLASGSKDTSIGIWSTSNFTRVGRIIYAHDLDILSIKWLGPGSGFFASAGKDKVIKIWDTRSYRFVRRLSGHTSDVTTLEVLSNGYLASGSFDSSVKIWNLNTAQEHIAPYTLSSNAYIKGIKQLVNGNLAIFGYNSQVVFVDLNYFNHTVLNITTSNGTSPSFIAGSILSDNGDKLVIAWSQMITVIDANSYSIMDSFSVSSTILSVDSFTYGNRTKYFSFLL